MELVILLSGKKVRGDGFPNKGAFIDSMSNHTPYKRLPLAQRKKELEKEWKHFEKLTRAGREVDKELSQKANKEE